jgi:alanine racemase
MALAETLLETADNQPDPDTGGTLTVDLAAIAANWRMLAHEALTVECAGVVKANAYGLGLEPVTSALVDAGCKTFFVADLAEARRVRARAPDATIYVLTGCTPQNSPTFIELNAQPVVNSMTELAEWDAFVAANAWQGGVALQVDTGMHRLGISPEEAMALAPRTQTDNHGITLLLSHLACAESADHPLTVSQLALFRELHSLYRGIPASLAGSSGIFLGDTAHYDLVRPGAALYGVNPTPGKPNPMAAVVELSGRILQVVGVGEGQTVGYGATWTAKRPSRIIVVALGYADGLLRSASASDSAPGGIAMVAGTPCPIVGRISMDLTCVDVTDVPDGGVHRGDLATFIGGGIGIDDFATAAGTIGYEVLTRLGLRCHLVYRGA